jgi:hypothetical protein
MKGLKATNSSGSTFGLKRAATLKKEPDDLVSMKSAR